MFKRAGGGGRRKKTVLAREEPLARVPPPPELLGDDARDMWIKQFAYLQDSNLIGPENFPLLVQYCNSWQHIVWCYRTLMAHAKNEPESYGITCKSADGTLKLNPAIRARSTHVNMLIRAGSLLGLDPVSRSRTVVSKVAKEDNPFIGH